MVCESYLHKAIFLKAAWGGWFLQNENIVYYSDNSSPSSSSLPTHS